MLELDQEERRRIYEEEKAKRDTEIFAKTKSKSTRKRYGCLIVLIVAVLGYIAYLLYETRNVHVTKYSALQKPSAPSRPIASGPTAEEEKMLKDLIESGVVAKIDANMNEAYVNPTSWASMKYENKKHLGWFLATYCGKKKGTNLFWADIYDAYSGKKLAKYSESWGFKVY